MDDPTWENSKEISAPIKYEEQSRSPASEAIPMWDQSTPVSTQPQKQTENSPTWDETTEIGPLEQTKAGILGLERGLTLGLSDIYRTKIEPKFIPKSWQTTPEEASSLEKEFPATSFAGNVLGGTALAASTGGLGGLLPEGASLAAKSAAMAGEGAIFGAGNIASEYALGDPDLNAQKIGTEIGLNALLGGSIPLIGKGLSKAYGAFKSLGSGTASSLESAANDVVNSGDGPSGGNPPSDPPSMGVKNTSIQEIQKKVNDAKAAGINIEMPQGAVLDDALSRTPMKYPVHPFQRASLNSQSERDAYGVVKDTIGKEGDALRTYESLQKNDDLLPQTNEVIQSLSPKSELTSDAVQAGNRANEIFQNKYKQIQENEGKIIGEFKKLNGEGFDHQAGLYDALTTKMPGLAPMFDITEEGIKLHPYDTGMSITSDTYNAVKNAFNALKKNPQDFSTLLNIRDGLSDGVNMLTSGKTRDQISSLKAAYMDYMQGMVDTSLPNLRDSMRKYAINEEQRQVIEKNFGGSVGKYEYGQISKIKPENIGDNIFKNTATVNAAKKILDPHDFGEILANWLTENKSRVTDKGVFSSNKWNTFLRQNQDALNVAFEGNPEKLQALRDHATIMRILPDAPPINPSGTAKTLVGMLKNVHGITDAAHFIGKFVGDQTLGRLQKQMELSNLNEKLAGRSGNSSVIGNIQKMVSRTDNKIISASKALLNEDIGSSAMAAGIGAAIKGEEIKKIDEHVKNISTNLDSANNAVKSVSNYAPNHAGALAKTLYSASTYLNSQRPNNMPQNPLDSKAPISKSEKYSYDRKVQIVNNPMIAMVNMKKGTLIPQDVDAIKAVYPGIYSKMSEEINKNIIENFSKGKIIPHSLAQSISMFLGTPLDSTMIPQSAQSIMQSSISTDSAQPQHKSKGGTGIAFKQINKVDSLYQTPLEARASEKKA